MSRKLIAVMIVASLLIAAGRFWKSGTAGRTADAISGWFAGLEDERFAEEQRQAAAKRMEEDLRLRIKAVKRLPAEPKPPFAFRGRQTAFAEKLRPDRWSRIVNTAGHGGAWYEISVTPENGFYIWFEEDPDPIEVVRSHGNDFGRKRGVFRLLGKTEGQSFKVTVSKAPW